MKLARWVGLSLALLLLAAAAATTACGKSSHGSGHHSDAEATPPPPPTPDTTPIETLRTPAGLVLKITPAPSNGHAFHRDRSPR